MSEPNFQLHCRKCRAPFFDMLEKLNHQDRCGQPAKLKRSRPKQRKNRVGVSHA